MRTELEDWPWRVWLWPDAEDEGDGVGEPELDPEPVGDGVGEPELEPVGVGVGEPDCMHSTRC